MSKSIEIEQDLNCFRLKDYPRFRWMPLNTAKAWCVNDRIRRAAEMGIRI